MTKEVFHSVLHIGLLCGRFVCENCGAGSPIGYDCNEERTGARAYTLATHFAPAQKNRVLPFTELADSTGELVWLEENNDPDELLSRAREVTRWERESHRMYFDGGRAWYADYTYGETWRCWLCQPMPEEMAKTPWEVG